MKTRIDTFITTMTISTETRLDSGKRLQCLYRYSLHHDFLSCWVFAPKLCFNIAET